MTTITTFQVNGKPIKAHRVNYNGPAPRKVLPIGETGWTVPMLELLTVMGKLITPTVVKLYNTYSVFIAPNQTKHSIANQAFRFL